MKRLLPILISPLLLCGCNINDMFTDKRPNFDKAYSVTAEISCGKFSSSCEVVRNGADDWTFSFTEPDLLMGMKLALNDSSITAELGDLNTSVEISEMYSIIPEVIAQSIDKLQALPDDSISEDENGTLTLKTDFSGNSVIITSDKSGKLLTLKCPKHKLSVEFSDMNYITQPPTEPTEEISIIFEDSE